MHVRLHLQRLVAPARILLLQSFVLLCFSPTSASRSSCFRLRSSTWLLHPSTGTPSPPAGRSPLPLGLPASSARAPASAADVPTSASDASVFPPAGPAARRQYSPSLP